MKTRLTWLALLSVVIVVTALYHPQKVPCHAE